MCGGLAEPQKEQTAPHYHFKVSRAPVQSAFVKLSKLPKHEPHWAVFLCFSPFHRKTITALSFSPDGKYLVTGEVSLLTVDLHESHMNLALFLFAFGRHAVHTDVQAFFTWSFLGLYFYLYQANIAGGLVITTHLQYVANWILPGCSGLQYKE